MVMIMLVIMCSITEIPLAVESEMQQNLHCLLSAASTSDNVHDVVLEVHALYHIHFQPHVIAIV